MYDHLKTPANTKIEILRKMREHLQLENFNNNFSQNYGNKMKIFKTQGGKEGDGGTLATDNG